MDIISYDKELFLEWKTRIDAGETYGKIAKQYGRSEYFVRTHVMDPDKKASAKITYELQAKAREDRAAGMGFEEIAEKYKIAESTARKITRGGDRRVKQSEIEQAIKMYYDEKKSFSEIAKKLNRHESTIRKHIEVEKSTIVINASPENMASAWDRGIAEFRTNVEKARQRRIKKSMPVSSSGRTFWK